jgi:ABC-type amino acid transport system permease subunit
LSSFPGAAGDRSATRLLYLNLTKGVACCRHRLSDLAAAGGYSAEPDGQAIEVVGIWMFVYLSRPADIAIHELV